MEPNALYKIEENESGEPCQAHLAGQRLHLYLNNSNNKLLIFDLKKAHSCTYNFREASVKFNEPVKATIICKGEVAELVYKAWTQPDLVEKKQKRPWASYTPLLIVFLSFLTAGLLIYFLFIPWIGQKLVVFFPESVEIEIGEALAKQYSIGYSTNDSADYYANYIWTELKLPNNYPIKIKVLVSDELNAFALPGGRIFIYSGLLKKMKSHEELVALMGHEVSHVTKRHSLKTMLRQVASGVVISAILGDFSEVTTILLSKADEFKQLDYSRELETEADNEGYVLMLKAGINPRGMLNLLEILKKENEEMPSMMKYLSTHPDTQARIDNIKSKPGLTGNYLKNQKLEVAFQKLKSSIK